MNGSRLLSLAAAGLLMVACSEETPGIALSSDGGVGNSCPASSTDGGASCFCTGADGGADPCSGVTCGGHGFCAVARGAPVCVCDTGYRPSSNDLSCEASPPPSCDGVTCAGHGTCAINTVGAPFCRCEAGYTGQGLDCAAGSPTPVTMTEVALLKGEDYAPTQQNSLAVMGEHLLVFTGKLSVIDVRDPAHPVPVGSAQVCDGHWGLRMALVGRRAFMHCLRPSVPVLYGYDLSDPAHPRAESATTLPKNIDAVAAVGTNIVAMSSGTLQIVDASNPASPTLAGSVTMPILNMGAMHGIVTSGSVVVVTGVGAGSQETLLAAVDLSTPSAPALLGHAPALAFQTAFAAANGYLYGGRGQSRDLFLVTDLVDPVHPRAIGGLPIDDGGQPLNGIVRWRHFALAAATGVTAIDLSSPSNPTKAGEWVNSRGFIRYGFTLGGDYLYASYLSTSGHVGLGIIELSSP